MSSLILELLDYAVKIGLDEEKFWTMTIPEVNRVIKAWGWRENRNQIFVTSLCYKLPSLISVAIWDSKNYPEIYNVFPELYDKEEIEAGKRELQIKKDIEVFKAWAESFNKRHEERNS